MLCFVFALLVVLLDQFIKRWILLTLALHDSTGLIPGVLGLTHVRNTGAAFSILADQRWLLIGIACVASLLLIAILLRYNDGFWGTLGLAAVLGGTVGNLVDRISYGYVIDIFEFQFVNFAIFNIADIFITLGGITFLIYFIASSIVPTERDENVFEGVPEGYEPHEYSESEDQIGLYDFQYEEGARAADNAEYEYTFDAGNFSEPYHAPETVNQSAYSEPESYSPSEPESYSPAGSYVQTETLADAAVSDSIYDLSALGELDIDLDDTGMLEDYDIDALLREYCFEED